MLGFCTFPEYASMTAGKPASREFYFVLKQSLLELRFSRQLPSPALGGLWMASRDPLAASTRVLHLGASLFPCLFWNSFRSTVTVVLPRDAGGCTRTHTNDIQRRMLLCHIPPGGGALGRDRAAAFAAKAASSLPFQDRPGSAACGGGASCARPPQAEDHHVRPVTKEQGTFMHAVPL